MKLDFIDFAKPLKVGFVGFGKMAEAIAQSMIQSKKFKAEQLIAFDLAIERIAKAKELRIEIAKDNNDVVKKADAVVLAIKPQSMDSVLAEISANVSSKKLVVSIAAGISLNFLEEKLSKAKIVRVMPNINCLVGEMSGGFTLGKNSGTDEKKIVNKIFSGAGKIIELEEEKLDAVTAVSGSGPAFLAYFADSMIKAGVRNGLSEKDASELALDTISGTIKFLKEKKISPQELIDIVASPAGTTVAGLNSLNSNEVGKKLEEAIDSAVKRSRELKR